MALKKDRYYINSYNTSYGQTVVRNVATFKRKGDCLFCADALQRQYPSGYVFKVENKKAIDNY